MESDDDDDDDDDDDMIMMNFGFICFRYFIYGNEEPWHR